jgi:AcrR family transcriptional regulator
LNSLSMSAGATPLKPRKSPVQARSAVTVDALHAATIQLLIHEGLTRCTTTRIAERAGASVGTLYQYYPNRDALLAAILEKHLHGVAAAVESVCEQQRGEPLFKMASAFVAAFLAAKLRCPAEARALYAVAEERGGAALAAGMRARIEQAVATMLASAPDAVFDDPTIVATITLGALVGPIQTLLKGNGQAEWGARFERELVLLVTAYLEAHRHAPEGRSGPASKAF